MQFGPDFHSGDGEGIDMKLSNKVYNTLKMHSLAENKRSQRLHEKKEFSTSVSQQKSTSNQIVDIIHVLGM